MRLLLPGIFLLLCSSAVIAENVDECKSKQQKLESTEGSAGTWDNLRNNEGSLRYETGKLLTSGLAMLSPETSIIISSKPKKFLKDHRDNDYCNKRFSETKDQPIVFTDKTFESQDDLNSWISDLSQGKGSDGRDLYRKCDKSCSPQYSYIIEEKDKSTLSVHADVLCGPVRDKNDNNYLLTLSCGPKE
jgi:hypothetical protein